MIDAGALDDARRQLGSRLRTMPSEGDSHLQARRLRGMLEEMGVRCDESVDLHDADGVLLASTHGTEALVAARLNDEQRHHVYARLVARLLLTHIHGPIDAKIEYPDTVKPIGFDREESAAVETLAHALMEGRLDRAPRPIYEEVPKFTFAFTPRTAARSTLGGFHLWSGFWYRRSNMYRRWRSRRDVSDAIGRVCVMLNPNQPATV